MTLLIDLAVAHIFGRSRQTVVAGLGVALGVGFSIAMAALMQGSQEDFVRQLVDTMPHVEITDEMRTPAPQPAELAFAAAEYFGLRPVDDRRGIRNPTAARAALEAWVPGRIAPALRTQALVRVCRAGGRRHRHGHRARAGGHGLVRRRRLPVGRLPGARGRRQQRRDRIPRWPRSSAPAWRSPSISSPRAARSGVSGSWACSTPAHRRATRARCSSL